MGSRGPVGDDDPKGHRAPAQEMVLAPVDRALQPLPADNPPDPPRGLLQRSRRAWEQYWLSPVARALEAPDLEALHRWIVNVDEWHRVTRQIRSMPETTEDRDDGSEELGRVVTGSQGQPVLNPLIDYKAKLETAIHASERDLGLTPAARARLGIKFGELRKTTAKSLREGLK